MKQFQTETIYNSQTVSVPLPHTAYVDRVLRSNSYEELMWRFMEAEHPAKEISESYGAFSNLKKICRINHHYWLHIGDGGHTRTAAIFAFFSKTLNFSIDPALNFDKFLDWQLRYDTKNIVCYQSKFEDITEEAVQITGKEFPEPLPYSITCVHAHVKLEEVDKHFPNWKYLYTNPCCYVGKQTFSKKYMEENNIIEIVNRIDLGILSEQRQVVIYKKIS